MNNILLRYAIWPLFMLMVIYSCGSGKIKTKKDLASATRLSNDQLLDSIQYRTFQYFWNGAEPTSGMACERIHMDGIYPENDQSVVTSGGSGFGVMAILVGIERGFITREAGVERLSKIAGFLEKADRFHGVWPHWMYGETGKVKPFGTKDNGGDIVETAYLVQGLICVKNYMKQDVPSEKALADKITKLCNEVEWSWYQNGKPALYWHWSPNYNWEMNFAIEGYNECLIAYVLGASSPTYPLSPEAYHKCWARGGGINSETTKYGYTLKLKHNGAAEYGGPLFWSHYSYLGLDPRNLKDKYANYWDETRNHVLIDFNYCVENPKKFKGYGVDCWGLTASYSVNGYDAHMPSNDKGVISPTAALSSFPYSPEESMRAARYFYEKVGNKLWGQYGFYDAFSETENWYPPHYLAIDQGPIVAMIENHRSQLLWKLFMQDTDVQNGLKKLGFIF
ncbi:MAG: glucoamylase family protein [Bacteroidota bacterium]|nr:glucoamylase family protein [Bacteroidota bacterium]